MTGKNLMMAAFAAATIVATPALAQMQSGTTPTDSSATSGAMQGGAMQQGSMQSGAMNGNAHAMTAAQTRTMKKCQAMSSDMMAKNKSCTKLMKMHPEMTSGGM